MNSGNRHQLPRSVLASLSDETTLDDGRLLFVQLCHATLTTEPSPTRVRDRQRTEGKVDGCGEHS